MKRALWPTAPIVALGFWGGISAWQSPAVATRIQAGMAIVWGCHILFCLWVWHRAPPDSGDAMVMPMVLLVSASFLVGVAGGVVAEAYRSEQAGRQTTNRRVNSSRVPEGAPA